MVLDPGSAFAGLSPSVRAEMLALTDVWSSNLEEAGDLLAALDRAPESEDLAVVTAAIAPLLRGDAITIVRDGAAGCAVQVDARDGGRARLPADTRRHQRGRRHPHRRTAGRGRGGHSVGRGMPTSQRRRGDQGDPARPGDRADHVRGRCLPRGAAVTLPVLHADCSRCFALCCVLLPFSAGESFPVTKPGGSPCRNLGADDRLRHPRDADARTAGRAASPSTASAPASRCRR